MAEKTNTGGAPTPEEAARKFADSLLAGDNEAALEMCAITNVSKDEALSQMESLASIYRKTDDSDLQIEIGEAEITGDEAEVEACFVANGKRTPWGYMALKIDGLWYIDMGF